MDGILIVAKPVGPTSHDIVGLIRRLSATKRVGHGGTLDPFASGVLPIFLGKATRLVEYHLGDRKRYRATVCFGASSTTDDLEGELTPSTGPAPSREAVEGALVAFRGPIQQRPPDYSAIKVAGRRAYAMARAGQPVELALRDVTIHAIDVASWDGGDPDRPVAVVDVECSAGTYVRSLARDLGTAVGSAAYLGALIRTASGQFLLDAAIDVDTIRTAAADDPSAVERLLLPVDAGLDGFSRLTADRATIGALARGQAVTLPAGADLPGDGPILVVGDGGRLVAIATVADGRLLPDKVLVDAPPPAAPVPDGTVAIVHGVDRLDAGDGPVFAVIGVFDGIHRGHQYLLGRLVAESRSHSARPTVITFDSHPDEILVGAAPPLLLDPDERIRLLEEAGVEVIVVQHFDAALRVTEYDEFLHRITTRTRLAGLLMTPDAAFGHDRRGTPETVGALAAREGFELVVVPPFSIDDRSVRSSEIRAAIAAGDLVDAERLLGRPYAVVGDADADGRLTFRMPVALPPPGEYEVRCPSAAIAVVSPDGGVRLPNRAQEDRVRVEFATAVP